MVIIKKLFFALPFLGFTFLFLTQFDKVIQNPGLVLSFDFNFFIQLILLSVYLLLSALFYIILITLSGSIKYAIPVALAASLLPLILFATPTSFYLCTGLFASFMIIYPFVRSSLLTYYTFKPNQLLWPYVKHTATLLIIALSAVFYLHSVKYINTSGMKEVFGPTIGLVTDSVSSKIPSSLGLPEPEIKDLPKLTPEQIKLLKQNPDLVRSYGFDPSILDQLDTSTNLQNDSLVLNTNDLIKAQLEAQVENFLTPYQSYIAPLFGALFLLTLLSFRSILTLALYPALHLIFVILEKTGYTKYVSEMREVKKLVV
jgi:hypothetical protein